MPRRLQPNSDRLKEAEVAIDALCRSPLREIGVGLRNALETARQGAISTDALGRVGDYVSAIIQSLPQSYGDRFWFDAGLIQAMANDWSEEHHFSSLLVPSYEQEWGYTRLPMPLSEIFSIREDCRNHVVELILLPGSDALVHVDLLHYPWIAHELAHSLMFRYDESLIRLIRPAVAETNRRLSLAAIPDRGRARAASRDAIEEFSRFWSPSVDHRNWTHELCADLIAAWVLGPAYLAALADLLDDSNRNPYQISSVHPPYAVRAGALLRAAQRLGFASEAEDLVERVNSLGASQWRSHKTNRFLFLADTALIDGIVDCAFHFCKELRLREWSKERMAQLAEGLESSTSADLGTDLLLIAGLAFSRYGEQRYTEWEVNFVRLSADSLRP
jgi:hypothetical protein